MSADKALSGNNGGMPIASAPEPSSWQTKPHFSNASGHQPALLPAQAVLLRPKQGRVIAGVCQGISVHLGIRAWIVRLVALALVPFFGAGIVAYILLVICVPAGDPTQQNTQTQPQQELPLAKSNVSHLHDNAEPESPMDILHRTPQLLIGLAVGVLLLAFALLFASRGLPINIIVPLLLAACGIGLSWMRIDSEGNNLNVLIISIILMMASLVIYAFSTYTFNQASQMLMISALMLAGVTVALIPWANSLLRKLSTESALKEREEERADMTAHLHDGVLQTLALIQLHATEPSTVSTLARSQERSLRDWLYQDRTPADRSVSSGIRDIAASIEVDQGKAIEVVTVSDAQPCEQTEALLDATRQALLNAATHGGEPISVYAETHDGVIEVFVRDHGEGFDIRKIPEDRLGIRESIIGRLQRRGGTVDIVSRPQWGTEVRMRMPLTDKQEQGATDRKSSMHEATKVDSQEKSN